jgi:acetolactate synthase-1/2/3 large subunit
MSSENRRAPRNGAELVVQTLEDRGVKYVFGIPGAKIDAVFDTLVDLTIQTVVCRHEQNAAFIAGGIGRMTGKAAVCIATSGPGVSNLVTGLATANSEGDPVVALGGAVATDESLKHIHQTMDSVSICKPVTKFSASVGAPHAVAEVVSNAFRAAPHLSACRVTSSRRGLKASYCSHQGSRGRGRADGAAIAEAARLINAAHTPVVLIGLLASQAANATAVREMIAGHQLPVVGTFQSAGAIAAHLLVDFGGRVGQLANQPADRLLEAADLVITVGYDPVEYWPSLRNKDRDRKIIHIDVLPADLDSHYRPAVELVGDIAQSLSALKLLLDHKEQPPI